MSNNSTHGVGPLVLIGAAIGLLFMFRPVRYVALIAAAILGGMFLWDTFVTEKYMAPTDYEFSVTSVEPMTDMTWMEHNPIFTLKGSFRNTSKTYIQSVVLHSVLYDCPTANSQLADCDKISTENQPIELNAEPGMRKGIDEMVHFQEAENQNRNLVVISTLKDVVGDTDRTDD